LRALEPLPVEAFVAYEAGVEMPGRRE